MPASPLYSTIRNNNDKSHRKQQEQRRSYAIKWHYNYNFHQGPETRGKGGVWGAEVKADLDYKVRIRRTH